MACRISSIPLYLFLLYIFVMLSGCSIFSNDDTYTVIGYHGEQPECTVRHLENSKSPDDIPEIIRIAKEFADLNDDYWQEPYAIAEFDDRWWVKFIRKDKLVERNGKQEVQSYLFTNVVCFQVNKSDLTCRLLPSR